MPHAVDFMSIRSWRGSQDQAFEELCYQLRDPTPSGATLIKTGSPDGGLEWYFKFQNGVQWGWQAKFSDDINSLLGLMEKSLRTVVATRPQCRRLTFCIPFDLPDAPGGKERKSARQKYEDRIKSWRRRIKGAERVKIELWSQGALLERLVNHPSHRGMAWFFWDQEVFSQDWCAKRLAVTVKAAGERYSPELHVDLPVAFALEGFAASKSFWSRYRTRRAAIEKRMERIRVSQYTGLGVTNELRELSRALRGWIDMGSQETKPPARLEREALLEATQQAAEKTLNAIPERPRRQREDETDAEVKIAGLKTSLAHALDVLHSALGELVALLASPASMAAETGALLLTGDAGQGKTHLFCDAGQRALDSDQPAVVLLGAQFSGRDVWTSIARQLGLGDTGAEFVVGAMQAAGEASNAPFLLLIDALNEAAEPEGWQAELPVLLAEVADNPWISVAVSVRSTFIPIVLPPDAELGRIAEVDHPGFEGRELEATERFFDHFGLQQPRIPLLTPEFTNPLFLKLYCEGLKGLGLQAPHDGAIQIGEVFARYTEWKEGRINKKLKLDPVSRLVPKALEAFSGALLEAGSDQLPRDQASRLINDFTPHHTAWPNTLTGQLLSEGLLAADVVWSREAKDYIQTLRFTYQRFGDYRAAHALLEPFATGQEFQKKLKTSKDLRGLVRHAPAGWIEALSVELPERFSLELLDAARWQLDGHKRWTWDRALVRSIVSRKPSTVSERSRELLTRAQNRTPEVRADVLEGLLAIAPDPSHPLNSDFLHERLLGLSLPDRDVAWSMPTYSAFAEGGALDRLLRWAGRGAHDEAPDEVVQLAAMPIAWCFTSPNRRLRDYATKALVRLLQSRLPILPTLLSRFAGVNDPYVMERLAVSAYGAVLAGGLQSPESALDTGRTLRAIALDDPEQRPNIVTRDAVRGIFEWCLRQDIVESAEYEAVKPPYASAPPSKSRTKKQLERSYERRGRDGDGNYVRSGYAALFSSLFEFGDFGRYVVEPKVRDFTQYPLDKPVPSRKPRRRRMSKKKLAELEATLSSAQKKLLSSTKDAFLFVEDLTPKQRQLILDGRGPSRPTRESYSLEKASCWIFEQVLALGWTPERFDEWEQMYARSRSRSSSSRERFGKKYQWIALREIVARLADNFHMRDWPSSEETTYRGPWHFFGRDIDPSLPPAGRVRDKTDAIVFDETFSLDPSNSWWVPPGPSFRADDPPVPATWASEEKGIPEFEPLVRRRATDGSQWIALQAYYNWDEERDEEEEVIGEKRRDLWSHIKSWLVKASDADALIDFLNERSLMGNWMPEGLSLTDGAYLGEMPWAESTREYPAAWQEVDPRREPGPPNLLVYPTWIQYLWEGNVLDAAIDNSVQAMMPAPLLFETGNLRWTSGSRQWCSDDGQPVAEYRQSQGERHSVLLVQESWLVRQLEENGWSLIVGWLGEKQLFDRDMLSGGLIGSWTEINGMASLVDGEWRFGDRRLVVRSRHD